jgi:hypothetical protein
MIVSAHQVNYIPSKAFFDKMKQSHIFVLLDDVQYEKNGYTNRNRITPNEWLTIPVKHNHDTLIKDVEIDYTTDWKTKHVTELFKVHGATNNPLYHFINRVYEHPWEKLIGINLAWIREICSILSIKTNCIFSSQLNIETKGSQRILDICIKLGADQYLSGPSGKNYLDLESFDKAGINISWMPPQEPNSLSVLDNIMRGKI